MNKRLEFTFGDTPICYALLIHIPQENLDSGTYSNGGVSSSLPGINVAGLRGVIDPVFE